MSDKPALPVYSMEQAREHYAKRNRGGANPLSVDLADWLSWFDFKVRPIQPGELVFIMAGTGCGKTSIMQQIALNACSHLRVLIFELELPLCLMYERFASMEHNTESINIERSYERGDYMTVYKSSHIWICPESTLDPDQMSDIIRRASEVMGGKPDVVMVDYVGLMTVKGLRGRTEQMTQLAIDLKKLAKKHDVVLFSSVQIARKGHDEGVEVELHDARDSGQIENSAGLLLGMWRDELDPTGKMWLKVLKNTKGQPGWKECFGWDGRKLRLYEIKHEVNA